MPPYHSQYGRLKVYYNKMYLQNINLKNLKDETNSSLIKLQQWQLLFKRPTEKAPLQPLGRKAATEPGRKGDPQLRAHNREGLFQVPASHTPLASRTTKRALWQNAAHGCTSTDGDSPSDILAPNLLGLYKFKPAP